MADVMYISLAEAAVVRGAAPDLMRAIEAGGSMVSAPAILFAREESWSTRTLYYVLAHDDLENLFRRAGDDLDRVTRYELFDFLNIHEDTEVPVLALDAEPDSRAVAMDDTGSPIGLWIEAEAIRPSARRSFRAEPGDEGELAFGVNG